jgi:hypothetical protein
MTRFLSAVLVTFLCVTGAFAQTPPAPTELRVSPSNHGTNRVTAFLTWRSTVGNQQYRIYRSAGDSANFAAIGTTNFMSYHDSTIVIGTRFYYYVKAFVGATESNRSNIANILIPIPPPLPTPTNLVAVNAPQRYEPGVRLTWRGGRGQWIYRVYRSTNNANTFRSYASTSDTSLLDRGVRGDSTYYYYVRSTYSFGDTTGTPRSNTASVLVTLPRRVAGTVRGTIIDDSTSAPIRRVLVSFYRSGQNWGGHSAPVYTDSLGRFTAQLDSGRYIMRANPPCEISAIRYKAEYYNNCYEPACATVIVVGDSTTFTANMGLGRLTPPSYNYVSGVVMDTANRPLRNARVSLVRTMQEMNFIASLGLTPGIGDEALTLEGVGHTRGVMWSGWTDSLGRYRARVLSNNRYIAMASKETYLPEYWNNKPTAELADIIAIGTRDTSGIDFSLAVRPIPNNSVAGSVRDTLGAFVPSRITLIPATRNSNRYRYVHTDSLGVYSITGIEAGKYFVLASPFSGYGFAYYKAGRFGVNRIADAETVNVTGNVTGITVGVRRISNSGLTLVQGRIRSTTNAVVAGVRVEAFDQSGELLGIGVTDATGAYEIDAVAPGVVTVIADRDGYRSAEVDIVISENVFSVSNVNLSLSPEGLTSVGDNGVAPEAFVLHQNYPNPFNPTTTISFDVPAASKVSLQIFNLLGQQVATLVDGDVAAGKQEIVWAGKDGGGRSVASGMYFYQLKATGVNGGSGYSSIKKMLLLK